MRTHQKDVRKGQLGDECGVTAHEVSCWVQLLLTEAYHRAKFNVVITIGLKHILESKMGTPSSESIIEDVYLVLKWLEIVLRANVAAV